MALNLAIISSTFQDSATNPGFADIGEKVLYTFRITNTGPGDLTGITFNNPNIVIDPGFDGNLPVGFRDITGLYTIQAADLDLGRVLISGLSASGTTPTGLITSNTPPNDTEPLAVRASLSVDKEAISIQDTNDNKFTGDAGDTIVYKIGVKNTSPRTAFNVVLRDFPGSATTGIVVPLVGLTDEPGDADAGVANDLAIGGTATGFFNYIIQQEDLDTIAQGNSLLNRATASGTTRSNSPISGTSTTTVDLAPQPDFTIVKIAGNDRDLADSGEFVKADGVTPGTGQLGEKIKYKYLFKNTGNVTLTNVTATDDKITGSLTFDKTTLLPGETATATALGDVTQVVINAGNVTNTVTATATPPSGLPLETKQDDETVTLKQTPNFTIEKIAGNLKDAADPGEFIKADGTSGTGQVGERIKYTYKFTNIGNVTLTDVQATDDKALPLPGTLIFDKTTLQPGEVATATYLADVTQALINNGSVKNIVTATAKPPSGPLLPTQQDDETVNFQQNPNFTIEKIAGNLKDVADPGEFIKADGTPGTGLIGEKIKYTYKFTNTGNVKLTNVTATDDKALPTPGTLTFDKTELNPGEFATASYLADVTQALINAGSVKNTVTATATPPSGPALTPKQDDETVLLAQNPNFTIVKIAGNLRDVADAGEFIKADGTPGTGAVGEKIKYTYLFTNTGNVKLTNITATDDKALPLPGNLSFDKTELNPGEVATATYLADITAALITQGSVKNTVTATAKPPTGGFLPEKQDDETVQFQPPNPPQLKLIKTAGKIQNHDCDPNPSVGDTVTYTYEITNIGPVDVFNLTLKDDNGTLDAGDDFFLPIEGLTTIDTVGTLNDLGVGKTAFGYYTKTLTAEDLCECSFTNIGTVEGFSRTGQPVSASDSETIVFCPPSIHLEKCATLDLGCNQTLDVGDVVKYSFHVSNTGSIALNSIAIDDAMLKQNKVEIKFANNITSLAPGECVDAFATYKITQADIDAGYIKNVATVYGNPSYGNQSDRSDDVSFSAEVSLCLPKPPAPEPCLPKHRPGKGYGSYRDGESRGSTRSNYPDWKNSFNQEHELSAGGNYRQKYQSPLCP